MRAAYPRVPMGSTTETTYPRIADDAVFVPVHRLEGRPHVAVDCGRYPGTVLALSHWPAAGTPAPYEHDTSALIADRYLRNPPGPDAPEVGIVTNDHYDEDGLFAMWLLLERPAEGSPERELAIAASEAGDFGTWTDPWAPRTAIAAMRMAEPRFTPFPDVNRILHRVRDRDPAGDLYEVILPRVRRLLADPERFRMLWRADWERIEADMALIDSGEVRIDDVPEADLAVVRTPRPLHDMALYPRTPRMRVMQALPDGTISVRHRFETWVTYVSRPLAPRVDLTALVPRLQALEERPGTWVAEDMGVIRPLLYLRGDGHGPAPSSIGPDRLAAELVGFLRGHAAPGG